MKVSQAVIKQSKDFDNVNLEFDPDLILVFISPSFDKPELVVNQIREKYSKAIISGCSTSGEIQDVNVYDESMVFTAIKFEKTRLKFFSININETSGSFESGSMIADALKEEDLSHILIFSDGLNVNGADLVEGLTKNIPKGTSITGGLAGDAADFNKTFVINNGEITDQVIVGIGLYGDGLQIGYGSKGGWDSFGIERKVTQSKDNILYELDDQPALELYKSFLGNKADELPGSGLLFPLSMRADENALPLVRTILAVDENEQSLTFAGNIPEGSYVRLMKANIDRLIGGAEQSAENAKSLLKQDSELAILISCVGRRLVLKQLVEEEIEAVRDVLGDKPAITGFYSYGELAPFGAFTACQLHNQTMTITTFSEK